MDKTDQIELIEAYLDGRLSGKALDDFESKLAKDPEFAEEVKLHADLAKLLKSSPESEFRSVLATVSSSSSTPAAQAKLVEAYPVMPFKSLLGLYVLLSLISIGFFVFPIQKLVPDTPQQPANESIEMPQILDEPVEQPEAELPREKEEKDLPSTPSEKIEPKAEKSESSEPELFAANFTPNPLLESQINNNFRSSDIRISVSEGNDGQPIRLKSDLANFSLSIKVEGNVEESRNFRLLLFNNSTKAYQGFNPLWKKDLSTDNLPEDKIFKVNAAFKFPPGLYYYLLEDEDSGDIYAVNKFTIIQ
ncbi:MAG: hypothetical protein AAF502_24905 [Bacteroidota bacterium]